MEPFTVGIKEAGKLWAAAERARLAERRAAELLAQLLEERGAIDRLRVLLQSLPTARMGQRTTQWRKWAHARLELMERQLSAEMLEERLARSQLFGLDDLPTGAE